MNTHAHHHASVKAQKLAQRLSNILILLYQGGSVDKHQLAHQFGVDVRTIERDLGERLRGIAERCPDGQWTLANALSSLIPPPHLEDHADLASETTEVLLRVAPEVAHYFALPRSLSQQRRTDVDGSLLVMTYISNPQQLLPLVCYWMPHVQIVQPVELHQALVSELRQMLDVWGQSKP